MKIDGSLIVVPGASSGTGAETARVLARAGAHVVLVARRAEPIEAIAGELQAKGSTATAVAADLGRRADAATVGEHVLATLATPDAIIDNAGARCEVKGFAEALRQVLRETGLHMGSVRDRGDVYLPWRWRRCNPSPVPFPDQSIS